MLRYDFRRRRTYLFGWHLHHGFIGLLMAALGAVLCWHDKADFPWLGD